MNIHLPNRPSARAPSDPPARLRWTAAELEEMFKSGVLHPEERVELIDGEIIAMNAKGNRHEIVRSELALFWARRCPENVKLAQEPGFNLHEHEQPQPDILIFPAALFVPYVRGPQALLVVEVSDSSLSLDLNVKAPKYAQFCVREYWVVDAETLTTTVHLDPRPEGYGNVRELTRTDLLVPSLVPSLAVRLSDLKFE